MNHITVKEVHVDEAAQLADVYFEDGTHYLFTKVPNTAIKEVVNGVDNIHHWVYKNCIESAETKYIAFV
jgi:hypothetical protein